MARTSGQILHRFTVKKTKQTTPAPIFKSIRHSEENETWQNYIYLHQLQTSHLDRALNTKKHCECHRMFGLQLVDQEPANKNFTPRLTPQGPSLARRG